MQHPLNKKCTQIPHIDLCILYLWRTNCMTLKYKLGGFCNFIFASVVFRHNYVTHKNRVGQLYSGTRLDVEDIADDLVVAHGQLLIHLPHLVHRDQLKKVLNSSIAAMFSRASWCAKWSILTKSWWQVCKVSWMTQNWLYYNKIRNFWFMDRCSFNLK